jgi:L-alanine-DL-glutamate epimerase-like enolase superfamily enzyme
MDAALVRITADNGETGIGEITHGAFCYEPVVGLVDHFKRLLVGQPVLEINRIWELMYGSSVFWNRQGIGIGVMGGIDIALHDLAGKLLNVPVYQLLGGLARSRIRTYASNGLFAGPQPLIADARRAVAMGFTAYKMRVVTPGTIISQVEAFRAALPNLDVIVDAVQGSCAVPWAVSVSCKLAEELERLGVMWFEEPVRVENIEGYVEVRNSTSMNIAGAESLPTALAFKPYLDRNAFSVLQFDIATSGFTEGRRIMALADVYQKPVAIHSWGTVVSALAGMHLALASPSCAMTEYCFMDHPLNDLLSVEQPRPVGGHFTAPQLPGLGVKLDDETIARFKYQPGVNTMISTQEKSLELI